VAPPAKCRLDPWETQFEESARHMKAEPSKRDANGHDADHYVRKAEEYRHKARAAPDTRVAQALQAAAREFMRKARQLQPNLPIIHGVQ
jgi:Ser/Thr protein kinase RdoA (MazF antagonist)